LKGSKRAEDSLPKPGEVRLIGGHWKRSRLPVAQRPGLRPTPDRVRETLFNWLGQDLSAWAVLDAFAGSGALGFEAASRGAQAVVMIESDRALARSLAGTAQRLKATQVQVVAADAIVWMGERAARAHSTAGGASLRKATPCFDLILLDPPFAAELSEAAWRHAVPLLRRGGWLYLEAPAQLNFQAPGMELHRYLKAGAVHAHLWTCREAPAS